MEDIKPNPLAPAPGDRIPDLLLPEPSGNLVSFYDKSRGRPIIVAFCPNPADVAAVLGATNPAEGPVEVDTFAVARPAAEVTAFSAEGRPIHCLIDNGGRAAQTFGFSWNELGGQTRVFLLDPNQRLLHQAQGDAGQALSQCMDFVNDLPPAQPPARPTQIAPVLMIPRVFEPDFCRYLIDAFHNRGHEESGVYSLADGELRHRVDHGMKKRFDHYVRDDDLTTEISRRMARRVLPEIEKAFWYRVTKLEEFKIACYRASEKGYFRAHRDNFSPQTVHRRFALTLNLNAGEYEGGELRFPEYGPHLYKPATGEAIVFSCSLLHEAMDVTRGERYVLLAFLYGEDGARQKAEMARRMGQAGGR